MAQSSKALVYAQTLLLCFFVSKVSYIINEFHVTLIKYNDNLSNNMSRFLQSSTFAALLYQSSYRFFPPIYFMCLIFCFFVFIFFPPYSFDMIYTNCRKWDGPANTWRPFLMLDVFFGYPVVVSSSSYQEAWITICTFCQYLLAWLMH